MKVHKQRRLYVLTTEFDPYIIGGLGTAATKLTFALHNKGLKAAVISRSPFKRVTIGKQRGVSIVRFPKRTFYSRALRQYRPKPIVKWLRTKGYKKSDYIHIHSLEFTSLARRLKRNWKAPVIYTCHSLVALESGLKQTKSMLMNRQKRLLTLADRIIVPSRWQLMMLKKYYPFCIHKTKVVPHGVHFPKKATIGLSRRMLFVGRIIAAKGIRELIQAVALLRRHRKNIKLYVIGEGSKALRNRLNAFVKKHNLSSNIVWLGYKKQSQVQNMYRSYGAVVMPSRQESFGLVALEALSHGIPLVATRSGGLSEFVHGGVAQIIPKVTGPHIAKSIRTMWNNPKLTKQRVIKGRKLASRFKWPKIARRYRFIFKQARANKKSSKLL